MSQPISNFEFLKEHDSIFFELAQSAEQVFASDPNTTLIKLRQLGEAFAQDIAARCGIYFNDKSSQAELIHQIDRELRLDPAVRNFFHTIRVEGNRATHEFKTEHREALNGLKIARNLAIWYHQSFGKEGNKFHPGNFIAPTDPSQKLRELQNQISQLSAKNEKLKDNQVLVDLLEKEKQEYALLAEQMDKEARALTTQVKEQEQTLLKQREAFETHIKLLQLELAEQTKNNPLESTKQLQIINEKIKEANRQAFLTEELVRLMIDQQLIEAGWLADSLVLTWDNGTVPEQGKFKAIANYPIFYQGSVFYADYILFYELTPIAVIEAKCENINVAEKVRQAETYAKGFKVEPLMQAPWLLANLTKPWFNNDSAYTIPFVYSSNGRPYNTLLEEKSGTWFRDLREANNLSQALQHFHTPEGLFKKLTQDKTAVEKALQAEDFSQLYLRNYQQKAIQAAEKALLNNQRNCLIAMATGTGKTIVINALIYRFLKTKRFTRILILVDHTALGLQTEDILTRTPQEQQTILAKLYNLDWLTRHIDDLDKHLQLATVQHMVKDTLAAHKPLPIDSFDCIIIDEAHSGYILEQELVDGELATRISQQYLKEYQQLLNYFDAYKIGLTSTPVKRNTDFFGDPIYGYSYREAVADGYLVDYEPPILYQTEITQQGINLAKGNTINIINTQTGNIESITLENELNTGVDTLNRFVINKSFNEIICNQLAQELNPFGKEKSLIFCASDLHADMIKNLLDKAFTNLYGNSYDQAAVAKITVTSYSPEQLIKKYQTARYPNIAITVDLLTSGIPVPQICNLVFLRAVKSRILFEHMLACATQPCNSIEKKAFRLYDPLGVHHLLKATANMQPLLPIENPLTNLLDQLTDHRHLKEALNTAGEKPSTTKADEILAQIFNHCIPTLSIANHQALQDPIIKGKLEELTISWGVAPNKLIPYLQELGVKKAADFFRNRKNFTHELKAINQLLASSPYQIISDHNDTFVSRTLHYGEYTAPADFWNAFKLFIKEQLNYSNSLNKIITKPNTITKTQLKEIRLLLDGASFTETYLQIAWRNEHHQAIEAGLIGYIRQAVIDEPLISFETRVQLALQKIHALFPWSPIQRQYLNNLANHLIAKEVLDRNSINHHLNQLYGSSIEKLDQLLNGQLDIVISTLKQLWPEQPPPFLEETEPAITPSITDMSAQTTEPLNSVEKKGLLHLIKQLLKIN